jgi:hypothetical protein
VITGVILHLTNDLPLLVDMDELPGPADRHVRCTNVRTVDGKRPSFVHDRHNIFVFPLGVIRMIEAPAEGGAAVPEVVSDAVAEAAELPLPQLDEEPDEGLLARIRDI